MAKKAKKAKLVEPVIVQELPAEEYQPTGELPVPVEPPSSGDTQILDEIPDAEFRGDYYGLSMQAVSTEVAMKLMAPVNPNDVEIRPDGIVYLPEIKYRRILNAAFGPMGWALKARSDYQLREWTDRQGKKVGTLTREYALFANGRFVSEVWGEQDYYDENPNMSYATAAEAVRSNALVRCCKDLGIASELWDPVFIADWQKKYAVQVWRQAKPGESNRPQWRRKDRDPFYDETGFVGEKGPIRTPQQQAAKGLEDDMRRPSQQQNDQSWPAELSGPIKQPPHTPQPKPAQPPLTKTHLELKALVEKYLADFPSHLTVEDCYRELSSYPAGKRQDGSSYAAFAGVGTLEAMSEKLAAMSIKAYHRKLASAKQQAGKR
jgi:hypothetical protein